MKQVWKLNDGSGKIPDDVACILFRDGVVLPTELFSTGSSYTWRTELWKKVGGIEHGFDIIAYHCEGDYR